MDDLVKDLAKALEDLLLLGAHSGPCEFPGVCGECGSPAGPCREHQKKMVKRVKAAQDVLERVGD